MLTLEQRQIVKEARDIIADPRRWSRFASARLANGDLCDIDSCKAWQFCALGALTKAYRSRGATPKMAAEQARALGRVLSRRRGLELINDDQGHAAVLALFDRALKEKR